MVAMTKITYDELERMLQDPNVPDFAIAPYLMADREQGGPFDPKALPNGRPSRRVPQPPWAAVGEWLRRPFAERGICDFGLRHDIIRILIDALYDNPHRVAGDSAVSYVHVRGTLRREEWADEIHGTGQVFAHVADLLRAKLRDAGVPAPTA